MGTCLTFIWVKDTYLGKVWYGYVSDFYLGQRYLGKVWYGYVSDFYLGQRYLGKVWCYNKSFKP